MCFRNRAGLLPIDYATSSEMKNLFKEIDMVCSYSLICVNFEADVLVSALQNTKFFCVVAKLNSLATLFEYFDLLRKIRLSCSSAKINSREISKVKKARKLIPAKKIQLIVKI